MGQRPGRGLVNDAVVPRPNPDALQRRASQPAASIWVAASAGTGKTKVLADRMLRLLLAGTSPQRLLCLTFTRAAAAEMANRLNRQLGEWVKASDDKLRAELEKLTGTPPEPQTLPLARRLFARVLDTPGGMRIQTIHAFCESLLARFPLEAEVAPHFQVLDERSARELIASARDNVLERIRAGAESPLAGALNALTRRLPHDRFLQLFDAVIAERGPLADMIAGAGGIDALVGRLADILGIRGDETPESVIAMAAAEQVFDRAALERATAALRHGAKGDQARATAMHRWLSSDHTGRIEGIDAYVEVFLTKSHAPRRRLATKGALAHDPGVGDILSSECARLLTMVDRQRKVEVAKATGALLRLADGLLVAYEQQKRIHARLDYDDLILRSRDLLIRPGVAPWVLFKLDGGIDHILIDEAQDTNPEQWQVIGALAEEFFAGLGARAVDRTVFAVGDSKQSIYSFQRADPDAFARMRAHFESKALAAAKGWGEVVLNISFRSSAAVLQAVDAVFAHAPANDGVIFDGVPMRHEPFRQGAAGLVELWPPVVDQPTDTPQPWKPSVERVSGDTARARLARLLAAKISSLCDGRTLLESRGRPIEAGDIMVLVRRRSAFVDDLVRALKGLDVGVAGSDRLVLTDHIAVMDLISLGRFLLLPEDDLSLAEVLKSPLCGLDDDDLFALAHDRPATLWQALRARGAERPKWREAHDLLRDLLGRVDMSGVYDLYAEILGPRGGRRALLARIGPEAADPLSEFLTQALRYEREHVPSLQGFLHWLDASAVEIKRDLEHGGGNAVRIMTVHGAKGLEAPIVFLPDTLQTPPPVPALLWAHDGQAVFWAPARWRDRHCDALHDRAEARRDREYRRLLYVAMTRAQDRLYVCGWHGVQAPSKECWYHLIKSGLAAVATEVVDQFLAGDVDAPRGTVYRLSCAQTAPPDIKKSAPPTPRVRDTAWARRPPPPESETAERLIASQPTTPDPAPRSPMTGPGQDAARRGRIVHNLLYLLPNVPPAQRLARCREIVAAPRHGVDAASQKALVGAVMAVLQDPQFAPVFGPGSQGEVAVAGTLQSAVSGRPRSVSARIDRLAVTDDEVLIVDYKTGRNPPQEVSETPPAYIRQMAIYRAALRQIYPDRPVTCALLWVDSPGLMALPRALLDAHMP